MKYTVPLYLIAIALVVMCLQNAGVIKTLKPVKYAVEVIEPIKITGKKSGLELDLFGSPPIKVKIED